MCLTWQDKPANVSAIDPACPRMPAPEGRLRVPAQQVWQPHPHYLKWHREQVFKG
jgi:hypothetical protein